MLVLDTLLSAPSDLFSGAQTTLYVDIVQPLVFRFGRMTYDDDAYNATGWLLIGILQIAAMFILLRPLEAWRPVERWNDRKAVRVDVIYSLIQKLGLFNLAFFVLLQPWFDSFQGWLRLHGLANIDLENLWPPYTESPLLSFFLYLVVLDFASYWYHRMQHRLQWWWELHAVHHSQRQMTFWSDDRNHVLDTLMESCFLACIALLVGVPPSQFVWLIVVSQFMQSVQHVNAHIPLGRWPERFVVSPRFHRLHHAIGLGHEGKRYGCNFGILFPWWDILFRTTDYSDAVEPTGVRDQLPPPAGCARDYGHGFWTQQWYGCKRVVLQLNKLI